MTEPDGQRATIGDVARLAGVSVRTVSRVINDSPAVDGATRARVQRVIDELRYRPNAQARGLAARRSYLLGMIYDNPEGLYLDDAQRGVLSVCRQRGYELVVYPCDRGGSTLTREAVGFADRSKLDGVIVLPPISENNDLAAALAKANVRYVRLASIALDSAERVVILNERSGAASMAAYLAGLGHRTIGYITGPEGLKSTRERLEGFCDALERHGCEPGADLIARGAYSFQSGVDGARLLLDRPARPTAIFASNDEMAAGVLYAARERRLDVPGDLSVAGFDDSPLAARIVPSLTTIRRPEREMARLAATKLIALIEGRHDEARQLAMLEPTLVTRDSTRSIA